MNRANSKLCLRVKGSNDPIHPEVLQDLKLEVFQFSQKIRGLDVSEDIVSKLPNTTDGHLIERQERDRGSSQTW